MTLTPWLILAVAIGVAGLVITEPRQGIDRIDAISAGPWIVERSADRHSEFLYLDDPRGLQWTWILSCAFRFDDRSVALEAAAKLGGVVRSMRDVKDSRP
jgi:hypothetical protein